jgi:uncharacterized membrane protein
MDWVTLFRALHVVAVVHWIGGVAFVTLTVLPALRAPGTADPVALFERIEGWFAGQARVSVTLAGLSGFGMTWAMEAWGRFLDPGYWWMPAMAALWALFTLVLFLAEPLVLHDWFRARAARDAAGALALVAAFHAVLLGLAGVVTAAAVLGAHGAI